MNIDNPGSAAAGGGVGVGRPDEKSILQMSGNKARE